MQRTLTAVAPDLVDDEIPLIGAVGGPPATVLAVRLRLVRTLMC